jgi:hypothetical protein
LIYAQSVKGGKYQAQMQFHFSSQDRMVAPKNGHGKIHRQESRILNAEPSDAAVINYAKAPSSKPVMVLGA